MATEGSRPTSTSMAPDDLLAFPEAHGRGRSVKNDRQKILIVDDAGPVVVLCVNVLQSLGYAVKGANRGERALELVAHEEFDLMVVDYRMPGMDGFQVVRQARAVRPDMAFILVTAHGTPEVLDEATRMGFSSILAKPFMPDELREAVERALPTKG